MKKRFTRILAALALLVGLTIPMGMWGQTYNLVSKVSDITDGDYVIAAKVGDKYYALSNTFATQISGVEITVSGGVISLSDAEDYVVTIAKDSENRISISNGTNYLNCKSSGTSFEVGTTAYYHVVTKQTQNGSFLIKHQTATRAIIYRTGTINKFGNYATSNVNGSEYYYVELFKYTPSSGSTVTAPTISPNSQSFVNELEVTITPAEGTTAYYTTDGTDPDNNSGTGYTEAHSFTINQSTEVRAIAYNGDESSSIVTKEYTKVTPLANIAALTANTEAGTYYVNLNNAVVTYVYNNDAYIQDASGAVLMHKSGHGLTAGNILNGTATVDFQFYNANPQITNLSGVNPVSGTAPEPTAVAQSVWSFTFNEVISKYLKITGATLTKSGSYYYVQLGEDNVQLFKAGGAVGELDLSKTYSFIGFPMLYNTTKEFKIFADPEMEVGADPILSVTPTSLSFTYAQGATEVPSSTFTITGGNLTDDVTVTLPAGNFTMYNGSDAITSPYTLTPNEGAIDQTITVKMNAGLGQGTYDGTITIAWEGDEDYTVALTGTVAAPEAPHYTWDLTIASYDEGASADLVTWSSTYATMTNAKGESTTGANNYLGGGDNGNYTHTRFYKDQVLTITPAVGYAITSIKIDAMTSYVEGFTGNDWTNATVSTSGTVITVTPTNSRQAASVVISKACRATGVTVYYEQVQVQSYELEIEAENGTVTVAIGNEVQTGNEGSYQIPEGSTVTLTATPATNYRFVEWQAEADDTSVTVTIENNQFVMPSCYVLVQAVFEEIPTYVYQYSRNGVETTPVSEQEGTVIQLASADDLAQDDFTFAGWTTDANNVTNLLAAGSDFTLDDTYEFFAVYEHTTTVGSTSNSKEGANYVKVTKTSDITNGNYLIVYEDAAVAFDGGLETLDAVGNTISVFDYLNEGVIASNATTDAAVFTIAAMNGGYSVKSKSGKYIGHGSYANGLTGYDEAVANNITITTEGNVNIVVTTTGGDITLKYNTASNQTRFRYYKSGQQDIQLYKYTEGGVPTPTPVTTTAYYTRVFLSDPTSAVEIAGPSIVPSGVALNMGNNNLTNELGAAKLVIEDGAQYIGNSVNATVQKNITACTYSNENNAGYYLIASPIYDNLIAADVNGLLTNYYDLYKFDNTATLEWLNYKAGTFTIDPEVGYLYASGSNTVVNFAGELNEYEDLYEVTIPNVGFNLIGNPFACNVYVYDESSEPMNFQVLNGAGQEFADGSTINAGDAFLVQTTKANQKLYFNHEQLGKASAVTLNVEKSRGSIIDNARVRLGEGHGMNKFYLNDNGTHIFIPQGDEEMAVAYSAAEAEMPVSFRASENGTYTLAVEAENVEMNYLHLIDNLTGMDVDLLQTPSYTFEAKTSDYASRFRLVFKANGTNENNAETFAYFNGTNWTVSNVGDATLQVVDVTGRTVANQMINGNAELNLNQPAGVYVIRLVNGDNVKTQKVVVR
jgi:hypothetical protein